jgi:hypothetical protein
MDNDSIRRTRETMTMKLHPQFSGINEEDPVEISTYKDYLFWRWFRPYRQYGFRDYKKERMEYYNRMEERDLSVDNDR